jgi:hypothetical protein
LALPHYWAPRLVGAYFPWYTSLGTQAFAIMKMHNTARNGALLALLASAGAAPTTTISAAGNAGASSADVYPPAGSKFAWSCAEGGMLMGWLYSRGQL